MEHARSVRNAVLCILCAMLLACGTSTPSSPRPSTGLRGPTRTGPLVIGETQLVGSEGLSVSPRGSYVLVERDNRFHVLASATLAEVAQLEKPQEAKAALALDARHAIILSPDESLAIASYTDSVAPGARWVVINEVPSGKLRQRHRIEKGESMGFAADGSGYFIAVKSAVSIYDAAGKLQKELPIETAIGALGAQAKLFAYTEPRAQSPVKVVDVASASGVAEWTVAGYYPYALSALAFSPDGTRVAAAGGYSGKVHVWAATTGALIFEKQPRDYQNDEVIFAPDGSLWSISGIGGPIGWDARGNALAELGSFSLDARSIGAGPTVVAAVDSYGSLLRWDRRSSALLIGPGLRAEASTLKFSADDKLLHLVSGRSESVASWDSETGRLVRVDRFRSRADHAWSVGDLAPENNAAWAIAQPKNDAGEILLNGVQPIDGGKRFVRVERNRVWLLPNGTTLELPFRATTVSVSPDAEWVLANGSTQAMETVPFTLFNLRTGARADAQPAQPADRARWSRAGVAALWFEDGRSVTLFNPDGSAQSLETPAAIDALAFSPSGKTIALGCRDGVVRLFDVATRNVVSDLAHPAKGIGSRRGVPALAFSNDGHKLASGNREGTIVVWPVDP